MFTVEAWPVLTARATSRGGQTWIPPPTLLHTTHTPPSGAASHSVGLNSHSSAAHKLRWNVAPKWDQDDTPSPFYFPCYSLAKPT